MESTTKTDVTPVKSGIRLGLTPMNEKGTSKPQATYRNEQKLVADSVNSTNAEAVSPTESDITSMLTIEPFTAPAVQMILWFSWTTTATPDKIARMHNQVFPKPSHHEMTRWDVLDIENDVAMHWRDLACSIHRTGGMINKLHLLPLLVPPRSSNPWSCVCRFGVEDCWNHKRDWECDENLVKLTLARMMWDAAPKLLVMCPYGRRRPATKEDVMAKAESNSPSDVAAVSKSIRGRLGWSHGMKTLLKEQWRCFLSIILVWIVVIYACSLFESTDVGRYVARKDNQLLYTGVTGIGFGLGLWIGCGFFATCSASALAIWVFNNSRAPYPV